MGAQRPAGWASPLSGQQDATGVQGDVEDELLRCDWARAVTSELRNESRRGGNPAQVADLSPPSRRRQGNSLYGMCVMSGCTQRAVTMRHFRLSGEQRSAPVCRRHAGSGAPA